MLDNSPIPFKNTKEKALQCCNGEGFMLDNSPIPFKKVLTVGQALKYFRGFMLDNSPIPTMAVPNRYLPSAFRGFMLDNSPIPRSFQKGFNVWSSPLSGFHVR